MAEKWGTTCMNCGRYSSAEKKIADISSTAPHDAVNTH
jgi:hypothetical protein